jgi:NAD(P)-dependent dehydrogenase (short-subunit alcohol dehydrogenase family)
MLLENKIALVTGGASGIGRATALAFAREGARVAVTDIDEEGGRATVERIGAMGGTAEFFAADMLRGEDIRGVVQRTVERFLRLDVAFNNAAYQGKSTNLVECTEDEWDTVFNINLKAVWLCMKYEIPEMLKVGGGAIVNTSSGAGNFASPNLCAYTTSKHGVVGLSRSAAVDFGASNIRVNVLLPGATQTPMLDQFTHGSPSVIDAMRDRIPLKRIGTAEEQAEAVVWLCSDRSSFISGLSLVADGGLSAKR